MISSVHLDLPRFVQKNFNFLSYPSALALRVDNYVVCIMQNLSSQLPVIPVCNGLEGIDVEQIVFGNCLRKSDLSEPAIYICDFTEKSVNIRKQPVSFNSIYFSYPKEGKVVLLTKDQTEKLLWHNLFESCSDMEEFTYDLEREREVLKFVEELLGDVACLQEIKLALLSLEGCLLIEEPTGRQEELDKIFDPNSAELSQAYKLLYSTDPIIMEGLEKDRESCCLLLTSYLPVKEETDSLFLLQWRWIAENVIKSDQAPSNCSRELLMRLAVSNRKLPQERVCIAFEKVKPLKTPLLYKLEMKHPLRLEVERSIGLNERNYREAVTLLVEKCQAFKEEEGLEEKVQELRKAYSLWEDEYSTLTKYMDVLQQAAQTFLEKEAFVLELKKACELFSMDLVVKTWVKSRGIPIQTVEWVGEVTLQTSKLHPVLKIEYETEYFIKEMLSIVKELEGFERAKEFPPEIFEDLVIHTLPLFLFKMQRLWKTSLGEHFHFVFVYLYEQLNICLKDPYEPNFSGKKIFGNELRDIYEERIFSEVVALTFLEITLQEGVLDHLYTQGGWGFVEEVIAKGINLFERIEKEKQVTLGLRVKKLSPLFEAFYSTKIGYEDVQEKINLDLAGNIEPLFLEKNTEQMERVLKSIEEQEPLVLGAVFSCNATSYSLVRIKRRTTVFVIFSPIGIKKINGDAHPFIYFSKSLKDAAELLEMLFSFIDLEGHKAHPFNLLKVNFFLPKGKAG